jgi:hypothetical protein
MLVIALAPAATAALGEGRPDTTSTLLGELERTAGTRATSYYARQLPAMLRTAYAAGDPALARRLTDGLEPRYPLDEHALCSARAQHAEQSGDHGVAATLYADAATGWREFGNVPEQAHALLGQGRCLLSSRDPAAEQPLRAARELFAAMGYRPALAETEGVLEQMTTAPAA